METPSLTHLCGPELSCIVTQLDLFSFFLGYILLILILNESRHLKGRIEIPSSEALNKIDLLICWSPLKRKFVKA